MKLQDNFTYSISIRTSEKYSFLVLKEKSITWDNEGEKRMHVMLAGEGY